MHAARSGPAKKLPWRRWLGYAAVWLALAFWAACYRMPYNLRIGIFGYSFLAMATVGLGVGLRARGPTAWRAESWRTRWPHVGRIIACGVSVGVIGGIALFAVLVGCNGTFRSDGPFVVNGVVASKHQTTGRGTTYLIDVREDQPARMIRLNLSRAEYERVRVGDHYREEFQVGLFGWPCRAELPR